jgi:hypothetical protein
MAPGKAPLGILMLETSFHRPPGDVGNPGTWPFPVLFETVAGAAPRRVVGGAMDATLEPFVAAAARLVARGAAGVITSCGFLASLQPALAARVAVPVATSALLQLPVVARCLPQGAAVGVLTYDAAALGAHHFTAVGADPATPVAGLPPYGALHGVIERNAVYDAAAIQAETLAAAAALVRAQPRLRALLLECTNLPPFAPALRRAFALPVFDVVTMGCWFHAGLSQPALIGAG